MTSEILECLQTDGSNYGILCHRQYADRIREALLPSDGNNWSRLLASSPPSPSTGTNPVLQPSPTIIDPIDRKCTVIPTPDMKGPRKSRTGYSLLVFQGTTSSPVDLPPMARKQISWAGRLTHQLKFIDGSRTGCSEHAGNGVNGKNTNLQSIMKTLTHDIWNDLMKSSFDARSDFLRIDVQPKSFNVEVCEAFTSFANAITEHNPIKLACSASKVSHVVNIVIESTAISPDAQSTSTIQKVYWGISENKEHFQDLNQRLNDNATSEVIIEPTDPQTGLDVRSGGVEKEDDVPWDAPVSRAYYKLAQVFEDDGNLLETIASLHDKGEEALDDKMKKSMLLSHGAGLDIGASPGGWTQVLCNTLVGIPTVVAMDPGLLAQRVMTLKSVRHLRAELTSEESITVLAQHAPYSVIVCDASVSNANELLIKIVETFDRVSSLLKKSAHDGNKDGGSLERRHIFAWPLCLVVTLKLPYKTHGSIDRNLEKVNNYIPDYLRRIALVGLASSEEGDAVAKDVEVKYKICHLFANSASERTLVAIFHKK
ncbi:hypothetical protein ACHAXR_012366 [Thalassiosira sp. AJA248-18]